jgi:AraC-like DNA-binding protein
MTSPDFGRGVLRPGTQAAFSSRILCDPGPAMARFVEFYWLVRWDLRGREPYETKVLSHPNVHLVFEEPGPLVYGVQRGLFVRLLQGVGHVLGVKFRPGCFRAFAGEPVARYADRRVPAAQILGPGVDEVNRAVLAADIGSAMSAAAEAFLLPLLPERPDPVAQEVAAMVERITAEPSVFRVDQLAGLLGVSVRRLQRLFAEYVGASPKWVLRRARLHEAALAADLGYADQAHLTRDFTAAVGDPPTRYATA